MQAYLRGCVMPVLCLSSITWPQYPFLGFESSPPSLLTELASDGLKGRVFEVAQADLQQDEVAFRKFRLMSEDVQGKHVLTNFHGMTLTTDKMKSLVKKWQVQRWREGRGVGRGEGKYYRECFHI